MNQQPAPAPDRAALIAEVLERTATYPMEQARRWLSTGVLVDPELVDPAVVRAYG